MKVTYLIGNGLDIHLGLKTSYLDFYNYLDSSKAINLNNRIYEAILKRKVEVSSSLEKVDWSNFEVAIGKYTASIKEKDEIGKFEDDYEEFVEEFTKFIETQTDEIDFDSFLEDALKVFSKAVIKPDNMEEHDQEKLLKDYKKASTEQKIRDFIIFNYTEILDKIYLRWESSPVKHNIKVNKPIHIHGYCHSELLLGVNDVTQISEDLAEDENIKAMLVKTFANELSTTTRFRKTKEIINASDMIVIFGMSLGESDKFWWELIIENLEKYSWKKVIIYAFDKDKSNLDRRINKMHFKRRQWQEQITKYSQNNNRENLNEQIFVQFNTEKIFNFNKLPLKTKQPSVD